MTLEQFSHAANEIQKTITSGGFPPRAIETFVSKLAKSLYNYTKDLRQHYVTLNTLQERTQIDSEKLDPATKEITEKTKSAPILNNVQLYTEGPKAFQALSEAIRNARRKIEINMFSWADDSTGMKIAEDIESALKNNPQVNVTLRLDKFGQFFVGNKKQDWERTVNSLQLDLMEKFNIGIIGLKIWNDPNAAYGLNKEEQNFINQIFKRIKEQIVLQNNKAMQKLQDIQKRYPSRFKMILENNAISEADHSKVVITDDTVFTGGMNIGDEYSGGYDKRSGFNGQVKKNYWKDYMLRFDPGPAATLYRNQFFHLTRISQQDIKRMAKEWAESAKEAPGKFSSVTLLHNRGGEITDKEKAPEEKQITYTIFYLMKNAKKEILIEHAYIQDQKVVNLLKNAAKRGVHVRLIKSMPESPSLEKANEHFLRQLQGIPNISIYQSDRVLHTKSLMVDGKYSIIGSCNLSTASLSYHEENSLYVQGESPLNKQIRAGIEDSIKKSRKVQ